MRSFIVMMTLLSMVSCYEVTKVKSDLEFTENVQPVNPDRDEVVDFQTLQKRVMEPYNCTSCHSWSRNEEDVLKRIVIGNPADSSLYEEVKSGDMPKFGPAVSSADLEVLELYILNFKN